MDYRKEDLAWEAVRRNEEFKCEYDCINDLYGDETNISMYETHLLPFSRKWRFGIGAFPPHYDTDICEIKEKVEEKGEGSFLLDYPYHTFFNFENTPVIQYDLSSLESNESDEPNIIGISRSGTTLMKLGSFLSSISDRILVSIEPTANKSETKKLISEILDNARVQRLKEKQKMKGPRFNPLDIASYIQWLKVYDSYVLQLKEKVNKDKLKIEKGAFVKPKKLNWDDLTSTDEFETEVDNRRKLYLERLVLKGLKNKFSNIKIELPEVKKKPNNFIKKIKESDNLFETYEIVCKKIDNYCVNVDSNNLNYDSILSILKEINHDLNAKFIIEKEMDELKIVNLYKIRDNFRKKFSENVRGAIELIQTAPDINFSNPRT